MDQAGAGTFLLVGVLVILVICALLAWACSAVARWKGRSPRWGAVLGFFFGVIAIIVYALLPRRQRPEPPPEAQPAPPPPQ